MLIEPIEFLLAASQYYVKVMNSGAESNAIMPLDGSTYCGLKRDI